MDHLAVLGGEVALMAGALREADPGTPVAACPGWTVRELAGHLTGIHRWVLAALDGQSPPPFDDTPTDGDLAGTYASAGEEMVETLRRLPADHPCWTFDSSQRSVSFWRRRQVHEIAVHRWDVAPYPLSDEVAEDGLDELVDFWVPRMVRTGRTTLPPGTLHLLTPGRSRQVGEGTPEQTVHGSPGDLLLSLWGRGRPLPGIWGETRLTP